METVTLYRNFTKIKDYKFDMLNELDKRMQAWAVLMGVKQPPVREVRMAILDFFKKNYSDFSMNEIYEALNMAITEKIDVNYKMYNAYSLEYFASILNAYREYRKTQIKLFEQEEERERKETDWNKSYPDSEYYESFIKFIKENNRVPQSWDYKAVYQHMEETGEIKMSNEEKKKWKENVILEVEKEAREEAERTNAPLKSILANGNSEENIKFECRKRLVVKKMKEKYGLA